MKFTPHILGAVAIVGIAGAVSGATIGDSPVLTRGHSDTLPEAPIVRAGDNGRLAAKSPPNHYPLKTPQGTIPVEELALRGRLRDRGGDLRWLNRSSSSNSIAESGEVYDSAFHYKDSQTPAAAPEAVAATSRQLTRAEAPMALAEPATVREPSAPPAKPSEAEVDAKSIDVAVALAELD